MKMHANAGKKTIIIGPWAFRTTRRPEWLGFASPSRGASALDDEANAGPAMLVGANERHARIFQNPHQKLRVGSIDRGGTVDGFGAIDGAWRQS